MRHRTPTPNRIRMTQFRHTSELRPGAGRDIGYGPTGEVELLTSTPGGDYLNASVGRSPRGSAFLVASILADRAAVERLKPISIRGQLGASKEDPEVGGGAAAERIARGFLLFVAVFPPR